MLNRRSFSKLLAGVICFPKDILANVFLKNKASDYVIIENVVIPIIRYDGCFKTDRIQLICSNGDIVANGNWLTDYKLESMRVQKWLRESIQWQKGNAFRFVFIVDNDNFCLVTCTAPYPVVACKKIK